MHVTGDEEVYAAVAIVVRPGGSRAEAARTDASLLGYIFKLAVAQVVIQRVAAIAGDVNILQAVVVVVGHGHAHSPTLMSEASGFGDVGEMNFVILRVVVLRISVLMVEGDHRVAAVSVSFDRRAIDSDDVELAVVVAVDESYAAAHGFNDVLLVGRRNVCHRQSGFLGDVFELWDGLFGVILCFG